jgi:flagellar hook-length control protein FliK
LEDLDTTESSQNETEQTTEPLFAEQVSAFQEDMTNVQSPELNSVTRMQQMVDIVNQVSEQLRSTVSADTTTMEMQLNPESLGKVYFSVVSKAGVMTATFQVQSEEAKQALESQMYSLRETLEAKNLKVESVDVQVSDFSFTQSNEAQKENQSNLTGQGKRRFRYDDNETEDEGVEEVSAESVHRQVMRDTGSSIDFTA